MKRLRWIRRLLLLGLAILLVGAAGWFVGRWYLRQQIIAQLSRFNPGPVRVDSVRLGWSNQQAEGVRLFDTDAAEQPWLEVDRAGLSLSVADILAGRRRPEAMLVEGATLRLELDAQGQLQTRLPSLAPQPLADGPLPPVLPSDRITVTASQWELRQQGRQPLRAERVELEVRETPTAITAQGTSGELLGGSWSFDLEMPRAGGPLKLQAATPEVALDSRQLARLPLVPADTFDGLRLQLTSSVDARLSYPSVPPASSPPASSPPASSPPTSSPPAPSAPAPSGPASPSDGDEPRLRYSIRLEPVGYTLEIAGQPVPLSGRGGQIVLENGQVVIRAVQADLFGGLVRADGRLDARRTFWQGELDANLDSLDLAALADSLGIRQPLRGSVSGRASFDMELGPGGRGLRGRSELVASRVRIQDVPLEVSRLELEFRQVRPGDPPTTVPADWQGRARLEAALTDVALEQLRQLFPGVAAGDGPDVQGQLTMRGNLDVPLETLQDLRTWTGQADVRLAMPQLGGWQLDALSGQLNLDPGKLELRELRGNAGEAAEFEGQAMVDWRADPPRLTAQLRVDQLRVDQLRVDQLRVDQLRVDQLPGRQIQLALPAPLWPEGTVARGTLDGQVELGVPLSQWDRLAAWTASGQLQSERLELDGLPLSGELRRSVALEQLSAGFRLQDRQLSVPQLRATWREQPFQGELSLQLARPHAFRAQVKVAEADAALAADLVPRLAPELLPRGPVTLEARVDGTLESGQWSAEGEATAPVLQVAGWEVRNATTRWQLSDQALLVRELRAEVAGGQVRLEGRFAGAGEGATSELSGEFRDLAVGELASRYTSELPLSFDGRLSGTVAATDLLVADRRVVEIGFRGLTAILAGLPVQEVQGTVRGERQQWALDLHGDSLDGEVRFQGQAVAPLQDARSMQLSGRLSLEQADLNQLVGRWGSELPPRQAAELRLLRGRLTTELDVRLSGPEFQPTGEGTLAVTDLAWNNQRLARRVESHLDLEQGTLRLSDIQSRMAGGQITGQLLLSLRRPGSGDFLLQLDRLQLADLLQSLDLGLPDSDGSLSGVLRGRTGVQWQGTGELRLERAEVLGLPVDRLRAPLEWSFSPSSGALATRLRFRSARLAGGRLAGELEGLWAGRRWDLQGTLRVDDADVHRLARGLPGVSPSLRGTLDLETQFEGKRIRSLDSFRGTFEGSLQQAQTLALPVLEGLTGPLGLSTPASETFSSTEFKGRMSQGIVQLERMTMKSPSAQLYIEGRITTRGRLDLNVTADTAQLAAAGVALGLIRPLDFLRRRLLFLHLGGTVRSPIVSPRTEAMIEQELVLFFLPLSNYGQVP